MLRSSIGLLSAYYEFLSPKRVVKFLWANETIDPDLVVAMATVLHQHQHHHHDEKEHFDIHEDARTEDTEMMPEEERTEEVVPPTEDGEPQQYHHQHQDPRQQQQTLEEEEQEDLMETSEDEAIDTGVQADMDKLTDDFPGFRNKYRLIKRIGEGNTTFHLCL